MSEREPVSESGALGRVSSRQLSGTLSVFDRQFRHAFDEEFKSLFRYVDRWSGDPALAADVAQETFIRLYRRGQLPENLGAWLISVANNLLRDERRRTARRERLLAQHARGDEGEDGNPGPEGEVLASERRQAVREALDQLRPRERSLLLLRHEGHSYRDLAKALGIREGSVGALLARARERFRAAMEDRRHALD
ncbi:MAG TPA: sigma-70 family RNA polymerase sigma factor [Gemmatimonadales bacterium]|nr:sigma-70 family RNA polymerase sigma factor [Gemmatimonadales bacterium]